MSFRRRLYSLIGLVVVLMAALSVGWGGCKAIKAVDQVIPTPEAQPPPIVAIEKVNQRTFRVTLTGRLSRSNNGEDIRGAVLRLKEQHPEVEAVDIRVERISLVVRSKSRDEITE